MGATLTRDALDAEPGIRKGSVLVLKNVAVVHTPVPCRLSHLCISREQIAHVVAQCITSAAAVAPETQPTARPLPALPAPPASPQRSLAGGAAVQAGLGGSAPWQQMPPPAARPPAARLQQASAARGLGACVQPLPAALAPTHSAGALHSQQQATQDAGNWVQGLLQEARDADARLWGSTQNAGTPRAVLTDRGNCGLQQVEPAAKRVRQPEPPAQPCSSIDELMVDEEDS